MPNQQPWTLTLFLVACCIAASAIAESPATTQVDQLGGVLAFDPKHGHRIASAGKWVGWSIITPDLNPMHGHGRAGPSHYIRYFVQQLDSSSPPVQLLDAGELVGRPEKVTILNDGWLLSDGGGAGLAWMANPAVDIHRPIHRDTEIGHFSVFPEGVITVTSEYRLANGGATKHLADLVWWLPILDHHIDRASRMLLEDGAGDNGIAMNFVRHRDEIAWLDATKTQDKNPQPPYLFVFDVAKQTVRKIQVTGESFGSDERIEWFDGTTAMDAMIVINAATGKTRRLTPIDNIIGLVDGTVYSTSETSKTYQLIATKLDDAKRSHVVCEINNSIFEAGATLVRVNGEAIGVDPRDLFLIADDSIRAWNGRTWTIVREGN